MPISEIVADVSGDMKHWTWSEEEQCNLKRRVMEPKRLLVAKFDQHCNSNLYTEKYRSFDHIVEYARTFGTLSVLNGGAYRHLNLHMKWEV